MAKKLHFFFKLSVSTVMCTAEMANERLLKMPKVSKVGYN